MKEVKEKLIEIVMQQLDDAISKKEAPSEATLSAIRYLIDLYFV